jgi:hypothetical protein
MTSPNSILRSASDGLRLWWDGAYLPPDNTGGLFFLQGHHRRHWTSNAAHTALDYFKSHHQWIIGLAVAVVLAVALKMR